MPDEKTREELLDLLKQCNPKQRDTLIQAIEGKASDDRVGYVKEVLSFLEPDMTARTVTFMSSRLCDCAMLVTKDNPLKGRCLHPGCKSFACASCQRICIRCGRSFCPRHATLYSDGEIYCSACKPVKWLKTFFCIGNKKGGE